MKITATKIMTTETAHRLCDYTGKCAHIHGHSYKWEVTASLDDGAVQPNGISIDFSTLKLWMEVEIYDRFDHALVLWIKDPLHNLIIGEGSDKNYEFMDASDGTPQKIVWTFYNPTAEMFAKYVGESIQDNITSEEEAMDLPQKVVIERVRVWETATSYGEWSAA